MASKLHLRFSGLDIEGEVRILTSVLGQTAFLPQVGDEFDLSLVLSFLHLVDQGSVLFGTQVITAQNTIFFLDCW